MKFVVKYFFIFIFLEIACYSAQAQNPIIDSLRNVLKKQTNDTNTVNTLNKLSENLWAIGNYDSSLACANKAQALAEKISFKKGMASALSNIGLYYYTQNNYPKALEYQLKALNINQHSGGKSSIAASNLGRIGMIYSDMGNYPKALEFYFKALTMAQEIGNKQSSCADLINIGIVLKQEGNYSKALEYYLKALKIGEELGNKRMISACYGNIGVIYWAQKNYPKALEYQMKDLAIDQETGNKQGIAQDLDNIAIVYHDMGDYSKELEYDNKSLKIYYELEEGKGVAINLINIGETYVEQKKYKNAKLLLDSALNISIRLGEIELIKSSYGGLSALDSAIGNYKAAFKDYKEYINYRDSLVNEANTKKSVQAEMNFDFEQKQAVEKAEQDKKDAINEQERKKQVIIRNSFVGGFLLMVALAFFIFRGYKQKQRSNVIITKQKEEVEKKNVIIEKQKALVEEQKALVEEKNKDITDSIKYASRIQKALLTSDEYLKKYLDYFILFKPRDIVSGDFYWAYREPVFNISKDENKLADDYSYMFHIACCDCTGHGVPGAFMSLLNISLLNETVVERKINSPEKILDNVRTRIIKALNPEGSDTGSKDGMDCIYCSIDMEVQKIYVACANNPLLIIKKDKTVIEIPADKMPVGIQYGTERSFKLHEEQLSKGDSIYLFTDGFEDQFGGEKGKKFKYKQLKELLVANTDKPMKEQHKILEDTFMAWKGKLEQVDDVLVIGIRL